MSFANAQTIDVHAHIVLAGSTGMAGKYGPEIGARADGQPWYRIGDYYLHGVNYTESPFMNIDLRLAAMQEAAIDFQVLSPNPLTYFHYIDARSAINFCQKHNDALASLVHNNSDKLAGLAALPMQDIPAACEELQRAVSELKLWGAGIGSDFGLPLNSPVLDPLYERLVKLDVPLYIHPAPVGIDGPKGDPNLRQFDLDLLVGFPTQEAIAVSTLIFGGVLERHPKLRIYLSHGGGAIPILLGRLKQATLKRPWVSDFLKQDGAFESQLSKLWFDTHVMNKEVLEFVKSMMGTDHLLLGTNFAGWDQHGIEQDQNWNQLLADNARHLFRP